MRTPFVVHAPSKMEEVNPGGKRAIEVPAGKSSEWGTETSKDTYLATSSTARPTTIATTSPATSPHRICANAGRENSKQRSIPAERTCLVSVWRRQGGVLGAVLGRGSPKPTEEKEQVDGLTAQFSVREKWFLRCGCEQRRACCVRPSAVPSNLVPGRALRTRTTKRSPDARVARSALRSDTLNGVGIARLWPDRASRAARS